MKYKVFISYSLRDNLLDRNTLSKIDSTLRDYCIPYIDLLHNDSYDKQKKVESEVACSDLLILLKTPNSLYSKWVQKELSIALSNNIPVHFINYKPEDNFGISIEKIKELLLNTSIKDDDEC